LFGLAEAKSNSFGDAAFSTGLQSAAISMSMPARWDEFGYGEVRLG